jgi:hypothetical protein
MVIMTVATLLALFALVYPIQQTNMTNDCQCIDGTYIAI